MFVVDTNILVYAANANCPEHARCRALLEQWRHQKATWFVTWGVLYGFLRLVTHPRVLPQPWKLPAAWEFVEALRAAPSLEILTETERHGEILAELLQATPILAGNLISDLHIAALMREHGIKTIYTRDSDFQRFSFLEVQDPLQTSEERNMQ